jgi:hypothetical protein
MCACKETDVRESPNNSTVAGGEGQGSRGETCHPHYRESPVSSVADHSLQAYMELYLHSLIRLLGVVRLSFAAPLNFCKIMLLRSISVSLIIAVHTNSALKILFRINEH